MKKILSVLSMVFMIGALTVPITTVNASMDVDTGIPNGFELTVAEFAEGIKVGWNLGNSLDSYDGHNYFGGNPTPSQIETYWANPLTTRDILEKVKDAGFNAIRIPVTWMNFTGTSPDYLIREDWLNRVQEVVDYAIELEMYVIINVHHDDSKQYGWLHPEEANKNLALDRLEKVWMQIGEHFKNYPANLIFEGMNEVGLHLEWIGTVESRLILNEFNREFVETVRATGGNNAFRYLMCSTHSAAPVESVFQGFELPDDDRLMLSVHIYDGPENIYMIENKLVYLKANFIEKGIPVIVGEWGTKAEISLDSRVEHAKKFTELATMYGAKCFWWDDGGNYILLNRRSLQWSYISIVEGIMEAVNATYEDPFDTVHKWKSEWNAWWGGTATYHEDGSMTVAWSGTAGLGGKQNQYASKFAHKGEIANAAIERARREGKNIEFTVKLLNGSLGDGQGLSSIEVKASQVIPIKGVWIPMGGEHTFVIDVSDFSGRVGQDSIIQLLVQNYSVDSMRDVEIWVSPIVVS